MDSSRDKFSAQEMNDTKRLIVLQDQVCFFKQFYVRRADYLTLRLSFVTVSAATA